MGFFSRVKRLISAKPEVTGKISIYAPVSGKVVPIEHVPDAVFSEKIVGDGLAIEPTDQYVVAPIDGYIGKIFETNHAFSIESSQGVEIFVHLGIGTVELRGNGLKRLVKEGQEVKVGDPILAFDLDYLKEHTDSLLTPVLVANMEDVERLDKKNGQMQAGKDVLFTLVR